MDILSISNHNAPFPLGGNYIDLTNFPAKVYFIVIIKQNKNNKQPQTQTQKPEV